LRLACRGLIEAQYPIVFHRIGPIRTVIRLGTRRAMMSDENHQCGDHHPDDVGTTVDPRPAGT
jgi:hypothetical protein